MKIKSDIFVLSIVTKESKNKEPYVILNVADTEGNTFQIVSKEIDELLKLEQFTKYTADFELKSTKWGLQLSIVGVSQE